VIRFLRIVLIGSSLVAAASPCFADDWPTARHDAQRTAATPQRLAEQLHLHWTRELPRLTLAWPDQPKLVFDRAYEPIVLGSTLFVGSSRTDSLLAFNTRTGALRWTFHADGPIRFAPAGWEGKIYFTCDDGHLYCLDADTGKLLWKFRGGPSERKILGNQRLISTWPARGAPVIADGTVYFAASIWPFMGIFIHALDARTGKVIWTNDGDGSLYIKQPHNADAFGGVAPQGHLVVADDKLLVPGGRSVPACYDRKTGRLVYFRLAENGKRGGGTDVACLGDVWFNGGAAFERNTGEYLGPFPARCVLGDEVVGFATGKFTAFTRKQSIVERAESFDRKGTALAKPKWKVGEQRSTKAPTVEAMIEAGTRLYIGSMGQLAAIELPLVNSKDPQVSWQAKIEGTPAHLVAADDRLFAVTLEGRIYCFGEAQLAAKVHKHAPASLEANSPVADKAQQILEATAIRDGYCFVCGVGDGKLASELVRQSRLHVIGIDTDAERIQAYRDRMSAADLYGERTAAHVGNLAEFPMPPYLANLIVIDTACVARLDEACLRKLFASLRPYGGTACFLAPDEQQKALVRSIKGYRLAGGQVRAVDGLVLLSRVGPLPGAADWTHEHADAGNSRASRDSLVKAPLGILWFGGSSNNGILPRHGHGPQPQVVDGRCIIEGVDMLRALDIYTGRVLWESRLPGVGKIYNTLPHQPGANATGGNYISLPDGIYVLHGTTCVCLDPATGEQRGVFRLPGEKGKPELEWTYLNVAGDYLVGGANPAQLEPREKIALPERLQLWDRDKVEVAATLEGHTDDVLAIVYSPDGKLFATASEDKVVRLWDVATNKAVAVFDKHAEPLTCLAFSPDSKALAGSGREKVIHIWDVGERKLRASLTGHREGLAALAFSADGKTLASIDIASQIKLWDLENEQVRAAINGNVEDETAFAFAPGATAVAVGNSDGAIKVIDLASREAHTIEGHKNFIQALAYSPDGKTLAAGYRDKSVKLWDIATGKSSITLSPNAGPISCLAFFKDGSILAAGTDDATVHLWDLSTRKLDNTIRTGAGAVRALAPTADGKTIATASTERLIRFGPGYRSSTRLLVVMDRKSGKVLWQRSARDAFRNNSVALGGGRLYCVDRVSAEEVARLKRRGLAPKNAAHLLALDLKTGEELWSTEASVFGTWLGYSEKNDLVVEAGRKTRDSLIDEPKGMRVFAAATGKELWKNPNLGGPALLVGDLLIHDTGACDARTGKPKLRTDPITGQVGEWRWLRTYGCNTPLAAENLMTFRSGAAGYCDLASDGGTGNFGGFRASCTNNLVVAGGLITAPDYTRNCTCSYQNQTSLALVPMADVEMWTRYPVGNVKLSLTRLFTTIKAEDWGKTPLPIKHLALNIGAPGHRRAADGRLWLNDYPFARITVAGENAGYGYYNRHPSHILSASSSVPWVLASGCRGIERLEVGLKAEEKEQASYTLRLHFADPDNDRPGQRVFDVFLDDRTLLKKFDIAKEASGRDRGVVKEFKGIKLTDRLVLRFAANGADAASGTSAPLLCGFELLREQE
jgi:WD40 repeat protein